MFLRDAGPYLITPDGAVNLTTATVAFERDGMNYAAYQGDSLWFADHFSPMSACPEPSTLVQLVGETWVPRLETNVHSLVVHPWVKGSSLAAIVPRRLGPPWGYELLVLERNKRPPRAARRSRHHRPECETRIAVLQALLAFRSGEIFVFGTECETDPASLPEPKFDAENVAVTTPESETDVLPPTVMEMWRQGRHEFVELPFRELGLVEGVGPADMWATGEVDGAQWAIAHFDGATWQLLPERYTTPVSGLQVYLGASGKNARRLLLVEGRLLELHEGVTREHALPPSCYTEGDAASGLHLDGTELWITCREEDEPVLYTTRVEIAEVHFDADAPDRQFVSFTDKTYPRLDPTAPSLRSCGGGRSREFDSPPSLLRLGKPQPLPRPKPQPKPPSQPRSKQSQSPDFEFGY